MERTACPNCNAYLDDPRLISCPRCNTVLSTYEQSQKIQHELLTTHKETLVRELKKATLKSLIGWIFLGFSIIGAFAGWGLLQIYWGLQTLVTNRIAAQFEESRIRATLTEVAETRASKIIEDQLKPAIQDAKTTIDGLKEDLKQDLEKIHAEFQKELEDLSREVDFQKKLNEIQVLQSSAIADCNVEAFNALNHIKMKIKI